MTRPAPPSPATEVVRTRRLEVLDEDGVVRGVLACQKNHAEDAVSLAVYGPKGHMGVLLDCSQTGAFLAVYHLRSGQDVARLTTDAEGRVNLVVSFPDGEPAFEFDTKLATDQ